MKKAVTYARVSSERQKEEGTIESQLASLRDICSKNDISIAKEYIDDGWAGETLARPGLDQLRDDAAKRLFDTLYVWRADRLGRDHIDQGIVLRELKKNGITVFFGERQLTEDNQLQSNMESIFAEYENKQRAERSRRGKLHKMKSGKLFRTTPPFGYKFVKDSQSNWKLEINEAEAKTVRLIFELYLRYQSSSRAAEELKRRRIYTRKNHLWRPVKVSELIAKRTYIGEWHYAKLESVEPKKRKTKFAKKLKSSRKKRPESEWVMIKIPAIVSEEVFAKAQEIKKRNFKTYGVSSRIYILGGRIRCSNCGNRMVGLYVHRNIHTHTYYTCQHGGCGRVNAILFDSLIWNFIKKAIKNPKSLTQYIESLKKSCRDDSLLKEEASELLKQKNHCKSKITELWQMWDRDEIDRELITKKIGEYTQKEKELDESLKEIELRLSKTKTRNVFSDVKSFSKMTTSQLDSLIPERKKELVRAFIEDIRVNCRTLEFRVEGNLLTPEIEQMHNREYSSVVALSLQSRQYGEGYNSIPFDVLLNPESQLCRNLIC